MPNAPRTVCGAPGGCSSLALPGRSRCDRHQPKESDRHNADVRRWYRTRRWAFLRAQVLSEEMWCTDCLPSGIYEPAHDVHHKQKHHGDEVLFWSRANLTGLCQPCHAKRTARGE
jgi:5-methylcytosine-specific restriction protein A